MKKVIVLLAMLTFGCKKDNKEPEPTPEPIPLKVLQKQKVSVTYQNSCPTFTVDMKLTYAGRDTIVNNKSAFAFFEDSIKSETIKIQVGGTSCMTYSVRVSVNDGPAKTYTVVYPAITHTLQ